MLVCNKKDVAANHYLLCVIEIFAKSLCAIYSTRGVLGMYYVTWGHYPVFVIEVVVWPLLRYLGTGVDCAPL